MIARTWRGSAPAANADAYVAHLRTRTFPGLRTIPGHNGACLLRRDSGTTVEFLVITFWQSIDSIHRFAGDDPEVAVVPDEARALLGAFDARAVHWEVALDKIDAPATK